VEKVLQNSPQTEAIRHRMEEVRCDLDEDVQEIVEGARDMGKWRSYVTTYPWVCLGTALAVGYLIVPRRRSGGQPDSETLAELANQSHLLATANLPPKSNAHGMFLTFVGNLVMRGATAYALQQAGKLFATQAAKPPRDGQP
jgi:hypothetical protein